ncbi:Metacaspase-1A [Diplonema papillatum]|nr:Metacaspase-1A [Diplonema papillatum]
MGTASEDLEDDDPSKHGRVAKWIALKRTLKDFVSDHRDFMNSFASFLGYQGSDLKLRRVAPVCLFVVSPSYQGDCGGVYELRLSEYGRPVLVNNLPVWSMVRSQSDIEDGYEPRVLFMNRKDRWAISGEIGTGPYYICAITEGGATPLDVLHWAAGEPERWVTDRGITVAEAVGNLRKNDDRVYVEIDMPLPPHHGDVRATVDAVLDDAQEQPWGKLPGGPARHRVLHHWGQNVVVRDGTDAQWVVGKVVRQTRAGSFLVRPRGEHIVWPGEYSWDDIRGLSGFGDAPKGVSREQEYLAPDEYGDYYPVRVLKVADDGLTCEVLVFDGTAEGMTWTDVDVGNLVERDSVAAEAIRWRGITSDRVSEVPYKLDMIYSIGDHVEVRDADDESWVPGVVTRYHPDIIVDALITLEDGTPWNRRMYQPLVLLDKWEHLPRQQPHGWRQIRKRKQPGEEAGIPGARRGIIAGVTYKKQRVGEQRYAIPAAAMLSQWLQAIGFTGELRILNDAVPDSIPTRARLEVALDWLAEGAKFGDCLFLGFIGNASVVVDEHEVENALLPVDHAREGVLTDERLLREFLAKLPPGVKVTCLFDTVPATPLWDLPYKIVTEPGGALHFSHGAPFQGVRCSVTVMALAPSSKEIDRGRRDGHAGLFARAFCQAMAVNPEPRIAELLVKIGIELDGELRPQLATNRVDADGMLRKQFHLGFSPRWAAEEYECPLQEIILYRAGVPGCDGVYTQRQTPNAAKNGRAPWYCSETDATYQVRLHDGKWWVLRDVGAQLLYYYSAPDNDGHPPLQGNQWTVEPDGESPRPVVEMVCGRTIEPGDPADGLERDAILLEEIHRGRKRWVPGDRVVVAGRSEGSLTVRVSDGTWVQGLSSDDLEYVDPQEEWEPGDVVAVRDDPRDAWATGRVVRISADGWPFVKPDHILSVRWDRPGGYFFNEIQRVRVGVEFEGKDHTGRWFPILVTQDNGNGTVTAQVRRGAKVLKVWDEVYPQHIRRRKTGSDMVNAIRKEVEQWEAYAEAPSLAPAASSPSSPGGPYSVGDAVVVRDAVTEQWVPGIVKKTDESGPYVTPDGWTRGPYKWKYTQRPTAETAAATATRSDAAAADPPPAPAQQQQPQTGPWPAEVTQLVRVHTPVHSRMCLYRKVRCVRFTPLRLRDEEALHAVVGCFQVIASPTDDDPAPSLTDAQDFSGYQTDPNHPPENATVISEAFWKCEMPAAIVFKVDPPSCLFAYRFQTGMDSPRYDPVAWKVEVADCLGNGWALWHEVDMGQVAGAAEPHALSIDRLVWTPTFRPTKPWHNGLETYMEDCESSRCRALQSLNRVFRLLGTRADAHHGVPVYHCADIDAYLYLSAYNTWLLSLSAHDMKRNVGFLRGVDVSRPVYKCSNWELYAAADPAQWQYDPELEVLPFIAELEDVSDIKPPVLHMTPAAQARLEAEGKPAKKGGDKASPKKRKGAKKPGGKGAAPAAPDDGAPASPPKKKGSKKPGGKKAAAADDKADGEPAPQEQGGDGDEAVEKASPKKAKKPGSKKAAPAADEKQDEGDKAEDGEAAPKKAKKPSGKKKAEEDDAEDGEAAPKKAKEPSGKKAAPADEKKDGGDDAEAAPKKTPKKAKKPAAKPSDGDTKKDG